MDFINNQFAKIIYSTCKQYNQCRNLQIRPFTPIPEEYSMNSLSFRSSYHFAFHKDWLNDALECSIGKCFPVEFPHHLYFKSFEKETLSTRLQHHNKRTMLRTHIRPRIFLSALSVTHIFLSTIDLWIWNVLSPHHTHHMYAYFYTSDISLFVFITGHYAR